MITKRVKVTNGETIVVNLVATKSDCKKASSDHRIVDDKLPLVHIMVSYASGDPFFNRKQLRDFIKKLQEIDDMWDVAVAHDS
jgi:hypothetical protein